MPWFGAPATNIGSTALPQVQTLNRSTDVLMSTLGRASQLPALTAIPTQNTRIVPGPVFEPNVSDAFERSDEHFNDLIGLLAIELLR